MNEEIDDTGAFLQDFTAVSDWEILILRIEEVSMLWKLSKSTREPPLKFGDFQKLSWEITKENIDIENYSFSIARYKVNINNSETNMDILEDSGKQCQAMCDLATMENDFDKLANEYHNVPLLATWFGLRDFIVLTSKRTVKSYDIKLILSSVNVAINNTGCEVPMFIQCLEPWQQFYVGVCEHKGLCIKFDTVHLQKVPSQCHYLIGLLDIFKGKISSTVPLDTVQISTKFTYVLSDFASLVWMQQPPDFEFLQGKTLGISNFATLPFGAISDPVKNIYLYVSWLKLSEDTVVDSQSYTDYDPLLAPFWKLSIEYVEKPSGLLNKFYNDFINLAKSQMTSKIFLDEVYINEPASGTLNIPKASFKNNMKSLGQPFLTNSKYYNTLSYDTMKLIIQFLFLEISKYDADLASIDKNSSFAIGGDALKASISHDLVWRLAVVSAHISQAMGDVRALVHIWFEFTQEMRYRWDNSVNIEGVMDGFPNSRTCLLHQKLQMLNVCIERRKAHDMAAMEQSGISQETSSESEDEFYECSDDESLSAVDSKKHSLWNRPVGRLAKFGNQKLLDSGDQMYIPITQEPVPKTEDQLEQDAEVMLTLETGPARSETIARIMSASLLSDMESFKAANPGAVFEDFIRWYSPRDWIEEDDVDDEGQKKGHLSARMLIPDNMWVDVWKSAKPVPAKRQRRLFDDTKEAEKILHFLESRTVTQIVDLLMPSLTLAVLEKLGQACENRPEIPQLESMFERVKSTAINFTRERVVPDKYKHLAEQMYAVEAVIARLTSLKLKTDYTTTATLSKDVRSFFAELISKGEAQVPSGARGEVGGRICALFRGSSEMGSSHPSLKDNPFPQPSEKEFVLRVMAHRPAASSTPSLQMMRAIISHNSFRILGAFTEDTVFT